MKRILAVFLTLAMALNIAPMAAFAAADSDAASIVAVEETDENASSQPDEQTARAIASDPFLQAAYAQTEQKQTGQAEVDTSDVSMEATDSFGKLLLADIDEQQTNGTGNSNDKITGVTVSGNTATVEYLSYDYADLVVAIYTDDAEQEMVASGTAGVMPTLDDKIAQKKITLKGNIPSSFVVKAYMISDPNHEPLCNAFVSNQYTSGMQELEDATINDFDEARTINLDDDVKTNFAVVNEEVVLVDASRDEVAMEISDNGDGSYTITNADEKTRNLKKGDIFVYRADDGILVLKIEQIFAADSTVTIFGNENLELAEVFDVVKLQSYDDGSQLEYDGAGVDSDVHYQGAGVIQDPLEETNKLVGDLADGDFSASVAQKFVIGTDNFYKGKKEDVNDETHITSKFGINAVLNLKMTAKFQYLFNVDKQTMTLTFDSEISGGVEAKYASDIRVDLGVFKKEIPGVYLNYTPQFVFKGDVTGSFYYKLTQKQGYTLENRTVTNISEKPVQEFSIKISGTIYLGVEFAPSLNIGIYKLFKPHTEENLYKLVGVKLMLSAGAEGTITSTILPEKPEKDTILNVPHGDSIHECNTCLAADFYAKETMSVSIDIVGIWKTDVTIMDLREHIYTCYYSQDFGEFGEGKCPHKLYLVNISINSAYNPTGAEVFIIHRDGTAQSIGTLNGATGNYCYMEPGSYKLATTVGNGMFNNTFTVKDKSVDVTLKYRNEVGGTTGKPVGEGACGDNLTWKLDEDGTLTISGTGKMYDYTTALNTPWKTLTVKNVVIEEGVQYIGAWAFTYKGTIESFKLPKSLTAIGQAAFCGTGIESIELPDEIKKLHATFSNCEKLKHIKWPSNLTTIGEMTFNNCVSLTNIEIPDSVTSIEQMAFAKCNGLVEVVIPENVTNLEWGAFQECQNLKKVTFAAKDDKIGKFMFEDCTSLKEIKIPANVRAIYFAAFRNCTELKDVHYQGTKAMWNDVSIDNQYDSNAPLLAATIHCTDGDIVPNTENSITTGTASTSGSKFQATFANAKAGKEYVVLVSRAKYNSLSADNLIYINQITADADGELAVPFITAADAAEMTYVVACAQDDATVEPGQPDQPGGNKPGGGHPSSGDDGGGAAIILIGGVAAVAAVAGAVLMMPVKVEGTVKLADQPVTNATVQVLKNGNVAAQTTTDANGHFTVKVKRGGYTLRVQWTDASGQPVTRTVDFKAPNANLNVAA